MEKWLSFSSGEGYVHACSSGAVHAGIHMCMHGHTCAGRGQRTTSAVVPQMLSMLGFVFEIGSLFDL